MVYSYQKNINSKYNRVVPRSKIKSITLLTILVISTFSLDLIAENAKASGTPPSISNPSPSNGSTNQSLNPTLSIAVNDPDGDKMNITWYSNSSGSWVSFGINISCSNGTYRQTNSNFSNYSTTYWWNVTADDETTNTSATYHFTTIGTNIIYVDDDADPGWYDATHVKTIQEGIDNASAGYTIFVYNGTYNELSLEIDKTLHLTGEDKDTTIINCTDVTGYAVWIQVNDTTVSNFTITGQEYGIDLEQEFSYYPTNNTVRDCNLLDCGIYMGQTGENCSIINCWINNSLGEALEMEMTSRCLIQNNNFSWATGDGIQILDDCHYNVITGNEFFNCSNGISLYSGSPSPSYNTIKKNNFSQNSRGIYSEGGGTPNHNTYYLNNFFGDSIEEARDDGDTEDDTWYYEPLSLGNYWDDFHNTSQGAWDNNSDGRADSNYTVPGIGGYVDEYPLMNPFNGTLLPLPPSQNITYVDDDADPGWYDATHVKTIQEGIDNASAGYTIFVYNGTYNEKVIVNKTIDLIGEDKNGVFVNGTDYGFIITADWVNLSGFSVYDASEYIIYLIDSSHCTIFDCDLYETFDTIVVLEADIKDCSYNTIRNCEIHDADRLMNIWTWGPKNVTYNQIHNNTMHTCNQFGFEIYMAENNTIRDNTIIHYEWEAGGPSDNAIYIWGSHYNNISNNEISNWDAASIYFETYEDSDGNYSNYNVIWENNITNNTVGIEIYSGENNSIFYNNFNNTHNAFDNSSTNNNWSANWWENYDDPSEGAWDNNTDGYADAPYDIPGTAGAQDLYPLMIPWGTSPKEAPTVITNDSTGVGETNTTLWGYLSDNGNATTNCGFWYDTTSGGTTNNQSVGIVSKGDTFSYNASSLTAGQLYYFKAWANNSEGLNTAANEKTFLTKPDSPSGLTATASSSSQIDLAWIKGNGANITYIVRKTSSYPSNRTDGTLVYNGTEMRCSDTGLKGSTIYYYCAWSYTSWDSLHQWSDGNDGNITITKASAGGGRPTLPPTPISDEDEEESLTTKELIEELFNITLLLNFSAYDTDEDGIVDTFFDPNGILNCERYVTLNDNASFLISVYNDLDKLFIWDAEADIITLVTHTIGVITADVKDNKNKTRIVSVTIEKTDWVYIEVTDQYPSYPLLNVQTSDGRNISTDMIWREQDKIFVLDDPEREYQFIYSSKKKGFLFDVLLDLTPTSVDVGDNINALITLINVGEPGMVNGSLIYVLYKDGEVIWSEEENISVIGQKAFNKTISVEGLTSGGYTLEIVYSYGGNQTASAQSSFTVSPTPPIIIVLVAIIIVVFMLFLFQFLKIRKQSMKIDDSDIDDIENEVDTKIVENAVDKK